MLQWDVLETPLARREAPGKVPIEGKLLVLMVGLLMPEDVTCEVLEHRELPLRERMMV